MNKPSTLSSNKFNSIVDLFESYQAIKYQSGDLITEEPIALSKKLIGLITSLFEYDFESFSLMVDYEPVEFGAVEDLIENKNVTSLSIKIFTEVESSIVFCEDVEELANTFSEDLLLGKPLPLYFYLMKSQYRSTNGEAFPDLDKLKSILEWLMLFRDISDIKNSIDNGIALYFLIKSEKDKYTKPLEFVIDDLASLLEVSSIPAIDKFKSLLLSSKKQDLNKDEKRCFFKLSLVDTAKILKKKGAEKTYIQLVIENLDEIKDVYDKNYEVFIHNFALGEFHKEVEAKYFEYAEKIQAVLSDIQSKIYAIPAVLIGLATLSKVDTVYGYLFILFGVVITTVISHFTLSDQLERLKQTEDSMNFVFKKLSDSGSEKLERREVLSEITNMKSNLKELISTRKKRIELYMFFSYAPLLATIVLFFIKKSDFIYGYIYKLLC